MGLRQILQKENIIQGGLVHYNLFLFHSFKMIHAGFPKTPTLFA